NGIDCNCENDRDGRCRLLCGYSRAPHCEDDIDLKPNEFGRDLGKALVASIRPAIFDCNGTAIGPAEFTQSLHKSRRPTTPGRGRACTQKPDGGQLARLLRACRERPRCRAAEQRYERTSPHAGPSSGLAAARYHTVAPERRCASQQKLRADVADGSVKMRKPRNEHMSAGLPPIDGVIGRQLVDS